MPSLASEGNHINRSHMAWVEKERTLPLDDWPVHGLFYLIGDIIAKQDGRDWKKGQKLRMIAFPSGKQCELWESRIPELGGIVHIFGEFDLPFFHTRYQASIWAELIAEEHNYHSRTIGDNGLVVFDPDTGESFLIVYDDDARQMKDVVRMTEHEK